MNRSLPYPKKLPPKGTVIRDAISFDHLSDVAPESLLPFMDENDCKYLESGKDLVDEETLAANAFRHKIYWLGEIINRRHGPYLLATSRMQTLLTGKHWFLCRIDLKDWLKMGSKTDLILTCHFDVYGRGSETELSLLELLIDMDATKEYMLAFEINGDEYSRLASITFDPDVVGYSSSIEEPYHFKCVFSFISEEGGQTLYKWTCMCCFKIVAYEKRKSCSVCRERRYCSKECQIKDWPLHKIRCPLLKILHEKVG